MDFGVAPSWGRCTLRALASKWAVTKKLNILHLVSSGSSIPCKKSALKVSVQSEDQEAILPIGQFFATHYKMAEESFVVKVQELLP